MPADGISLPPKKEISARPAGAARRLSYINSATGRKSAPPHLDAVVAALRPVCRALPRLGHGGWRTVAGRAPGPQWRGQGGPYRLHLNRSIGRSDKWSGAIPPAIEPERGMVRASCTDKAE